MNLRSTRPEDRREGEALRRTRRKEHTKEEGSETTRGNARRGTAEGSPSRVAKVADYIKHNYLAVVAIAATLAGTIQNPLLVVDADVQIEAWNQSTDLLWSVSSSSIYRYIDDALVVLLFALSFIRWRKLLAWPIYLAALWGVVLTIALALTVFVTQPVPVDNAFFLYRQVIMPAMLLIPAFAFGRREWYTFAWWAIGIAVANSLYAVVEFFGVRVFSPATMAVLDGRWVDQETGLPGNFLGWWITGDVVERLGGLVVNPPTLGVLVATAAVLAWWMVRNPVLRYCLVALFVLVTIGSISRGGWVILVAGILFPYLLRVIGVWLSSALIAIVAVVAGVEILSHGGSGLHLNGLVNGALDGILNPAGRGFGWAGNYAENAESEESLLGIAFSAGGVIPILLVVLLVGYFLVQILRGQKMWLSALALGGLAVAALAETAGSIYGTIPLWIAIGFALRRDVDADAIRLNGPSAWLATHGLWGRKMNEVNR